jgi:hypothetical protein
VSAEQLRRYRKLLEESGMPHALLLLTRYPVTLGPKDRELVNGFIRWYQVGEWLRQERTLYAIKPESVYLVDQFLDFLTARNMTMEQVTWQLAGGVYALRALWNMMYEAAHNCELRAQPSISHDWWGLNLEKKSYWFGINLDKPEILCFYTEKRRVNKELAERLPVGGVHPREDKTGYYWERLLDLGSEKVHFFACPKASQLQRLESFLRECLETVRRIEIPGGEPPQDDVEEGDSADSDSPSSPEKRNG